MDNTIITDLREKRKEGEVIVGTPDTENSSKQPDSLKKDTGPQGRPDQNQIKAQTEPATTRPYLEQQKFMTEKQLTSDSNKPTHQTEVKKINNLINQTDRELYKISSVFPFDFFPDEISVDLAKVSITRSNFIFSKNIQSILLENIAYVNINMIPFFAQLSFVDVSFEKNQQIRVTYLKRGEALAMRRIIQGLIIARKEGVDFSKFSKEDLLAKVNELGNVAGEENL